MSPLHRASFVSSRPLHSHAQKDVQVPWSGEENSDQFNIGILEAAVCLKCHRLTRKMLTKGWKFWVESSIFGWQLRLLLRLVTWLLSRYFQRQIYAIALPTTSKVRFTSEPCVQLKVWGGPRYCDLLPHHVSHRWRISHCCRILTVVIGDHINVLDHLISIIEDLSQPSNSNHNHFPEK